MGSAAFSATLPGVSKIDGLGAPEKIPALDLPAITVPRFSATRDRPWALLGTLQVEGSGGVSIDGKVKSK